MLQGIAIAVVDGRRDLVAVGALFAGYAASLPIDLAYQDFASELASLPGAYAPPGGALLLARRAGGAAVGCIGVRASSEGACEMKRLYVRTEARGLGLGRRLGESAMEAARGLGYRSMRLDTLPSMESAIALYRRLGFRPCDAYYVPTPPGTRFMARSL